MFRGFVLAVAAAIIGLVAVGLVGGQQSVEAQQTASATRSFSPSEVEPDGRLVVTISVADYGGIGQLRETFPADFTFVESSPEVTPSGQTLTFNLVGDAFVSYTLTSATSGRKTGFSGTLDPAEGDGVTVGGPSEVTVSPPAQQTASATRSFSPSEVEPDGRLVVTISVADYGGIGQLRETFPADFTFVESSPAVTPSGQTLTFNLVGDAFVSYTLTSATSGRKTGFSGTLDPAEGDGVTVGGVNAIRVGSPPSSDDPCLSTPLSADGEVNGTWSNSCESTDQVGKYARYYSFMLTERRDVTINLDSDTDPYLYLRAENEKSGTVLQENDDVAPGDTNSQIQRTLDAGTYTIEATTYNVGVTGSFMLTLSTFVAGTDPCLSTPLSADGEVNGTWSNSCESTDQVGKYARYYSFMLTERRDVTINLDSDTDPYLYLRAENEKSGTVLQENDDVVLGTDTNSEIEATLGAGTYTIEATTYNVGVTGSFMLTLSTFVAGTDPCLSTPLSADGEVNGTWSSSCESTDQVGRYARYYSFTLTGGSAVTINLDSDTDPYLYLRAENEKSGTVLQENDDVVLGTDTNSEIEATLGAGNYTIEATTYSAGRTGSFTLTVSGL